MLCKTVSSSAIARHGYVLTAGAYIGESKESLARKIAKRRLKIDQYLREISRMEEEMKTAPRENAGALQGEDDGTELPCC